MSQATNWEQIKEWDKKYYLQPRYTQREYDLAPAVSAEGPYIHLPDGVKMLDFMSGYVSVNLGYCHPKVQAAIKEAADKFSFLGEAVFISEYKAKAAKLLMEDILGQDGWAGGVRFCVTGSEAVELAFMIAKLYTNRPLIAATEFSYHGWTMGSGAATTLRGMRSVLSSDVDPHWIRDVPGYPANGFFLVPGNNCYRCSLSYEYPACKTARRDGTLPCVHIVDPFVKSQGVERVAAIITEVAPGGGSLYPPAEYVPQLRDLTKALDILWIDDEVVCGFGRLGEWFGYKKFGVVPDIMVCGKGIANSSMPISACIVSKDIAEFLKEKRFLGLSTFACHPMGLAAAVASMEVMLEENIVAQAARAGEYLEKHLRRLQAEHPCVGQVSGSGVFWSVEIVKNKETREPFARDDRNFVFAGDLSDSISNFIAHKAYEKKVLLAGFMPNTILVCPPCTITTKEVDQAMDALDYALTFVDERCE